MKPLHGAMLLFIILLMFSLAGCSTSEQQQVKKAVSSEFKLLKDLDPTTVQKYLAVENLFPDVSSSQASSTIIEEVASLFFKEFDYKILKIHAGETTASCSVQIITLDAHTLAKDYQKQYLTETILAKANGQDSMDTSLEQHSLLLKDLIQNHTYETVSNSCTLNLVKDKRHWKILKDHDLENQLVGGFISVIANPYLLTPTETTDIYFQTLKNMDSTQMSNYLGLTAQFSNSDNNTQALANALLQQVRACFDYRVIGAQDNGSIATVDTEITSFSYTEIISLYKQKLDEYLATPTALIDGPSGRLAKSNELLIECITNNTATQSQSISLTLVNDGVGWKLQTNSQIGTALFGDFNADTAASALSSGENESQIESNTDSSNYSDVSAE